MKNYECHTHITAGTEKIAGEYITYRKVRDHATNMPSAIWYANGNEIKDNLKYKYDSCGNISEICENGRLSVRYKYDSSDRLIKSSDGMEYFYDHTGVAGFKYSGITYYYIKDVQGNITAILDSDGNTVVKYTYDAWGNHTVTGTKANTVGEINPFRYRSYFYDVETKFYYLKTRYYDPATGRFINMDSIAYADPETLNGLNLYAYCGNNPVNYYDSTGQFVISGTAITLGCVAAGAALLAWIELTFHPIQNAVEDIGNAVGDLTNDISINNSIGNGITNETVVNNEVSTIIAVLPSISISGLFVKQKYNPGRRGKRVRNKSRKEAEEAARRRGGGRPPRHHKGKFDKHLGRWIGPHYHPGVPEGHRFYHDHYFYLLLLLLGYDSDE